MIFRKLTKISGCYMHTETKFFLYSKHHQKKNLKINPGHQDYNLR